MPYSVTAAQEALKTDSKKVNDMENSNKIYAISDDEFRSLIHSSTTIAEVLFKLGYTVKGNSWGFSKVRQRMLDLNISHNEFKGKSALRDEVKKELKPEQILVKNCKHSRQTLRRLIIEKNLLEYKCAICGTSEWNGKTLSLEVDHINGDNTDNRIENLRFLCPNCHSQTETYGSRNSKLTESSYEISEELRNMVEEEYRRCNSIKTVSSKLGIRRKIVNSIVSLSGQKKSNQKYVIRYDINHKEIQRFGSLSECAKFLIEHNEVKTKLIKSCKVQINNNKDKFWLNSYWSVLDADGIKHNPLVESSLIESEDAS